MEITLDSGLLVFILGILITFLAWVGRTIFENRSCLGRLSQELTDLKQDFKEFIKEYRDNHKQ